MPHELRASDADRERCVARIRTAALEGRIDSDELEERLGAAYGARWCHELDRLVLDVTPAPPAPPRPPVFVRPRHRRVNGLAVASAGAGVFFFWMGAAFAIVLGHIALRQIRDSQDTQTGQVFALTGLALGYFWLATFLFVAFFAWG